MLKLLLTLIFAIPIGLMMEKIPGQWNAGLSMLGVLCITILACAILSGIVALLDARFAKVVGTAK